MLNDLRELVDWWRDRREALQPSPDASCKTERVTFDVEQRLLEAIRRQAELDGTTMTQVVHQAFQTFFAEKSTCGFPADSQDNSSSTHAILHLFAHPPHP